MRKLIFALALLAIGCTKKPIEHIYVEPKGNYRCYIQDSVVFAFRTCANSTHFDTVQTYYQPLTDIYVNFDSVTSKYMDSVLASTSIETKVCRMAWLFCESNATHDDMDTLTIYKRIKLL